MRSLRELEKNLETLESHASKHALHFTLDDGQNIQLNFKSYDDTLGIMTSAIKNEDHPYKKYVMRAVKGHPSEGQMVLTCKAIWESHSRIAAEKAEV